MSNLESNEAKPIGSYDWLVGAHVDYVEQNEGALFALARERYNDWGRGYIRIDYDAQGAPHIGYQPICRVFKLSAPDDYQARVAELIEKCDPLTQFVTLGISNRGHGNNYYAGTCTPWPTEL